MIFESIDWIIIILYFIVSIGIGVLMSKKAGKSTGDFFLSGRNLPWYIAGTSMVATTFAADTPLAVTELVAQKGIAGNWLWWNMLLGGMLTVFFFARLWRRANILTDAEFVSIRYSGKAASFLRGFRAVYIGIFMNVIVIAWVNLAMVKILSVMFPDLSIFGHTSISVLGIEFSAHMLAVGALLFIVAIYSALSGLWGVSITDTFQFIMAMSGSIALAIIALKKIGGIDILKEKLDHVKWVFDFLPAVESKGAESVGAGGILKMSVTAMIAYLGVQWWASWYPGAEPGGGGYVAQRMMSAKDEKHSLLATLWFQIAHYALRPWPWVIVALVTLVVYPDASDRGATYVMMIRDYMPSGLLGLMIAAFLAAFMSTIASQTVWGTSYIINDLYKPFIKPNASEKYYVKISRIATFILMVFSLFVTTQFDKISDAWKFVLALSAGIGPVLIFRWFWWRINAWSEISAMLAPYLIFPVLKFGFGMDIISGDFELSLLIIVAWSSIVWLIVTFVTSPVEKEKLKSFYSKVHPGGRGWKIISDTMPEVKKDSGYIYLFINWILGCILVMFSLFGFGKIIFHEYLNGIIYLVIALIAGGGIYFNLNKVGWDKVK
ncbi:MAG: Na+:solute symporter [Bacteroidales bacterium]|nr:Na+:solute symporter [Bacteroidales bacterium]MBN2818300.1 Na+:solute symporter [Bacteroidales bacterium]